MTMVQVWQVSEIVVNLWTKKNVLWNYKNYTFNQSQSNRLYYHNWHDSDRRSQLEENFEDIIQALDCLDSQNLIPSVYCEATDLLNIPSLSLDPLSEQIATKFAGS